MAAARYTVVSRTTGTIYSVVPGEMQGRAIYRVMPFGARDINRAIGSLFAATEPGIWMLSAIGMVQDASRDFSGAVGRIVAHHEGKPTALSWDPPKAMRETIKAMAAA